MTNNDILRSLRYMLDLGDQHIAGIIALADPAKAPDAATVQAWLLREEDAGFERCDDAALARFLDGLVLHFRGRDEALAPRAPESRITNNLVLKKLRVAFQLKDVDMHAVFASTGFPITKPELTALFRQPGHKHYRTCGDQALRNFLKGLSLRLRGE